MQKLHKVLTCGVDATLFYVCDSRMSDSPGTLQSFPYLRKYKPSTEVKCVLNFQDSPPLPTSQENLNLPGSQSIVED